jgi:hypothetical protein
MTRPTNARIAGVTFLVYLAATIASMVLFARATSGEGVAAQLAGTAQHATDVRLTSKASPRRRRGNRALGTSGYRSVHISSWTQTKG